jgi:apolipoprotein N-acyltransferase
MYALWQQEKLWGHLPLVLFVAAWLSLVLLRIKRYTRHPKGWRWLRLSTLSGVLLAAGFPPSPLMPLMFIGWVPLLIVEHEIAQEREGPSKAMLFKYSYHTFVLWNVLTTWWVGNTAFVAGIFAIWVNAVFMCGPFLLFHQTKKVLPKLAYGALIAYWISFEMLHLRWELSWSWLNLGNSLARFPGFVQWYEYTGVFGGALWILLLNVLIFKLLSRNDFTISRTKIGGEQKLPALRVIALALLPILFSLVIYTNRHDEGRPVEVVVVQPNFEPHYEKFKVPLNKQIERFIKLSENALTSNTEYLVFPETSFSAHEIHDFANHPVVERYRKFLEKYPKLKLVTGVSAYKIFEPGEPHTRHTRKDEDSGRVIYWEAYNAGLQLENGADSIPFYIKSKLVPGAEILPYHEVFFWLKPLVDKLDGSVEGHGSQPYREAFPSATGKVAPVICYESIFGEYHTEYMKAGAEAIFIMTNDGWWDNTAGHKQHLQFASLRAIETRRSIARSANTGISCFLNQRGDILQPTKYGEEAAVRGEILLNDEITFYVKWGDLIGRICVFATLIFALNTVAKGYLKKVNSNHP